MDDFEIPCGCRRHTERDGKGKVLSIHEAICHDHMTAIWEALQRELSTRLKERMMWGDENEQREFEEWRKQQGEDGEHGHTHGHVSSPDNPKRGATRP